MSVTNILEALNTSQKIKVLLQPNIDNLIFMLVGKNNDFTGPLNDGYQNNDWIAICIVCSTWLLSLDYSLTDINKQDVANIIFDLVYNLVKYNLIKLSPEDRDATLQLLSVGKDIIFFQILLNLEKIYGSVFKRLCVCTCFDKTEPINSVLQTQLKQLNK
jgi:hypothetical protein